MKTKVKATLLAALIALTAASLIPTITSRQVKPIKIGVITPTEVGYENYVLLYKEIVEPDINQYVQKLPQFRFTPAAQFEFIVDHAGASKETHLEKVQALHEAGVDLIIGGLWSSQANYALDYVNENGILLISSSSTSPVLSIPDDNLYRLCPDDNIQGRVLAKMMHSKGVMNAIAMVRDDTWGQGLIEVFETEFEALGGTVLGSFYYDPEETDFSPYLSEAEDLAQGHTDVSVLLLSFDERNQIILQASDGSYTTIYGSPPWFTTESGGRSQSTLDEAPDQAVHLKLYSPLTAPPDTAKYAELAQRYNDVTGADASYYTTTAADAAWILAQAVLETRPSAAPGRYDYAASAIEVLTDIASRHYGYSGWCQLNEAGDRQATTFDIWGYYLDDVTPSYRVYGRYDTATDELTWYP